MKIKYSFFLSFIFLFLMFIFPLEIKASSLDIYFKRNESDFIIDNANILSDELKDKINSSSKLISDELSLNIIFVSIDKEIPINKLDYLKNLTNCWGLSNKSTMLISFHPYSLKEPVEIYSTKYMKVSDNEKKIFKENLYEHQQNNTLDTFIIEMYKQLLNDDIKKENKVEIFLKDFKIRSDSMFHDFKVGLSKIFLPGSDIFINRLNCKLSLVNINI